MVNFKPFEDYLIWILNKLINKYNVSGNFLDAGGGTGNYSLFLAKRGMEGKLIDYSPETINQAKYKLKNTKMTIEEKDIFNEESNYDLILLIDVIEHVKEDNLLIKHCHKLLNKDGFLIITYSTNKKEWRNDDVVYGHYRRYGPKEIVDQLKDFQILESWDTTFPFFWLMRRVYSPFIKKITPDDTEHLNDNSGLIPKYFKIINYLFGMKLLWCPLRPINYIFRKSSFGFQNIILAKKI